MYTITLHDGTVLDRLDLNGSNFIASEAIDEAVFNGNLASVTITDGETSKVYTDMVLLSCRVDDGRTWFVLGEKSQQDKALERIANMETTTDDLVLMMAEIIGG